MPAPGIQPSIAVRGGPSLAGWVGYYINLDRSPDRRAKIENDIRSRGLDQIYRRFPAIDGRALPPAGKLQPGERGLFASHIGALDSIPRRARLGHIIEDDVVFSSYTAPALDMMLRLKMFDDYDIIFTEALLQPNFLTLRTLKGWFDQARIEGGPYFDLSKFHFIDLAPVIFAGSTSYVVNPRSVDRILGLMRREWEAGPTLPIDLFLRREIHQKRIRAACLFPFATAFDLSVIGRSLVRDEENLVTASSLVSALLRYSFFVGHDLDGVARPLMDDVLDRTVNRQPDGHLDLLTKAVGFMLSEHFNPL